MSRTIRPALKKNDVLQILWPKGINRSGVKLGKRNPHLDPASSGHIADELSQRKRFGEASGKFGDLQSTPLRLAIRAGRLVDAACERKDLQQEFWEYCHTDENSDRVGELAFGTNLGLTEMIGVLLQDEKFPGVHLAFGDPYGSQTHADWKSTTHVDVLTRKCDVWIDDQQVIEKGRYQLAYLGLS